MKSLLLSSALGGLALAISLPALAVGNHQQGFYFGGGIGAGKVKETVIGASRNKTTGFAYNVNGGYRFTQYLGAELGYTHYHSEDFGPGIKGDQNYAVDAALKGIIPFDNGLAIFGKLGVADVHHRISGVVNSGSFHRAALFVGGGVGYHLTSKLSVNTQVSGTTKSGPVPAMYLGTVGLSYSFD